MWKPAAFATIAMLLIAPVGAQTLEKPDCTKANIDSTQEKIDKMKDGRNKETAASEIATAREMLEKGQIDDCQSALLKASVQTK